MTNINDLYNVLREMQKLSNNWLRKFPDDKNELYKNMVLDEVIWMIESEDYFESMENIYMKDKSRT